MPLPTQARNRLLALLDVGFDAKSASLDAGKTGPLVDLSERVIINGREVKIRVQANDIDHPKEILIRLKWRQRDGA